MPSRRNPGNMRLSQKDGLIQSLSLNSWQLWFKFVFVQLLLMLHFTQAAGRMWQQPRRLQPYLEDHTNTPQHAPPVQSFLLSDNTWVDCIPMEGQISAHHPALSSHIIQTPPPALRRRRSGKGLEHPHRQRFAREVPAGCPEGGIPVQRRDPSRPPRARKVSPQGANTTHHKETHEYALTGLPMSPELAYTGVFSIMSVNAPALGSPHRDFSLSQLWLMDGSYGNGTLSTMEVGWQTYPYLHWLRGHKRPFVPHLFVYWTADAYHSTGCYNLECPGFVQYSNRWVIGGAMPAYDDAASEPAPELAVEVILDRGFMSWWLLLDNDPVGYWPVSIFRGGRLGLRGAPRVDWGGEIIYYKSDASPGPGNHSRTAMGSGAFPGAGYPAAAYHRNISFQDPVAGANFVSPTRFDLEARRYVDDPLCYDVGVQEGNLSHWGAYFFFGGPGGNNPGCVGRLKP